MLRAGAYELERRHDVPARVVVAEYVDVANAFVDARETGMVNAVLDQLARELRADEFAPNGVRAVAQTLARTGEERLIAVFRRWRATGRVRPRRRRRRRSRRPPASDLVLTADAIVAGVHFFPDDPPDTIARKALRVNLSDLAAKGAEPAGCLLSLALPEFDEAWLAAFARGLGEDADAFGCPLLGGDTVARRAGRSSRSRRSASCRTADGAPLRRQRRRCRVRHRHDRRRGARPRLRGAAAATAGAAAMPRACAIIAPLSHPGAAQRAGAAVRAHASAAMDVSDGLVGDLAQAVRGERRRRRGRQREGAAVGSRDWRRWRATRAILAHLLTGGDDYEILCAIPEAQATRPSRKPPGRARRWPWLSIGTDRSPAPLRPRFLDAQGRETRAEPHAPGAISRIPDETARLWAQIPAEIGGFGLPRRCAGDAILAWSPPI